MRRREFITVIGGARNLAARCTGAAAGKHTAVGHIVVKYAAG